jgi:hypothetical protein
MRKKGWPWTQESFLSTALGRGGICHMTMPSMACAEVPQTIHRRAVASLVRRAHEHDMPYVDS